MAIESIRDTPYVWTTLGTEQLENGIINMPVRTGNNEGSKEKKKS
jgi:hypothetical protein